MRTSALAELERRTEHDVAQAWGDNPDRQTFALRICGALAQACDWPSEFFDPDDSVQSVVRASGIRANCGAALAVGDCIVRAIRPAEWSQLESLTVGQLVNLLLPEYDRTCGTCGYSLLGNPTNRCPECGEKTRFDS